MRAIMMGCLSQCWGRPIGLMPVIQVDSLKPQMMVTGLTCEWVERADSIFLLRHGSQHTDGGIRGK